MRRCWNCGTWSDEGVPVCPACGTEMEIRPSLVEDVVRGEPGAKEEFYSRTFPLVYAHIRGKVSDRDSVLSLLQQAYAQIFSLLPRMKSVSGCEDTIVDVVYGLTTRWYLENSGSFENRFHAPQGEADDATYEMADSRIQIPADTLDDLPEERLDRKQTERLLMELLSALPMDCRVVLVSRYYDEVPLRGIAEDLHLSLGEAADLLTTAEKMLAEKVHELEEHGVYLGNLDPLACFLALLRRLELVTHPMQPENVLGADSEDGEPKEEATGIRAVWNYLEEHDFVRAGAMVVAAVLVLAIILGILYGVGVIGNRNKKEETQIQGTVLLEDYAGQDCTAVEDYLHALGLETESISEYSDEAEVYQVLRTDPGEGTELEVGDTVTIYCSAGEVPSLVGMTEEEAADFLDENGLLVDIAYGYSDEYEPGVVFFQSFASGGSTGPGTVFLWVRDDTDGVDGQQIVVPSKNYIVTVGDAPFSLDAVSVGSDGGAGGFLTYSSSNTAVASVDAYGTVTIGKSGTAVITVTAAATEWDPDTAVMVTVTVTAATSNAVTQKIVLSVNNYSKTVGDAPFSLDATSQLSTGGTGGALSYSSSDTSVATVDSSGVVTLVGAGTAVITIQASQSGGASSVQTTVSVTVGEGSQTSGVQYVDYTVGSYTVDLADTYSFNLGIRSVDDQNRTGGALSYSSSNAAVATVSSDGTVTPVGPGTAVITVTAAATDYAPAATVQITVIVMDSTAHEGGSESQTPGDSGEGESSDGEEPAQGSTGEEEGNTGDSSEPETPGEDETNASQEEPNP